MANIKYFVKNHEYSYIANSVDVKLQDEYCIKEELKLLNAGNEVLKRGTLMGYILNEDDTLTKVGHKKNKMKNKQKHKHIRNIKKNSKCKNRS